VNVSPYDLLTMIMTVQDLVGESGMSTDAAMLVGLLIFVGGLVFWVLLFCAGVAALIKGIRVTIFRIMDWVGARRHPHSRV
jgi:hypothetical protein